MNVFDRNISGIMFILMNNVYTVKKKIQLVHRWIISNETTNNKDWSPGTYSSKFLITERPNVSLLVYILYIAVQGKPYTVVDMALRNLSVCFEKLIKNENTFLLNLIYFYLFTILDRLLGQSRPNAKVMYSAKRVHACKVSQLFLCKIIRILWWWEE